MYVYDILFSFSWFHCVLKVISWWNCVCSAQSKEIIGRVLSSATSADVLHFLCSVSGLPEDNNKFKYKT